MKKFCSLILALCLVGAALCVSAFAANPPAAGTVIRVSGEKSNGEIVPCKDGDYNNFEKGWEAAVDLAEDHDKMDANGYVRVVVDFYADWNANAIGEFGDSWGDGFQYSTIYVPAKTKITMNLNGHTINRGLKNCELDGEVICVEKKGDLVINNGTISGGWSSNGAGGIHIEDDAKVVLNDVNITGNRVEDDDGAGMAVYNGASLTMNGGSVSNNTSYNDYFFVYGGGVYVEESEAIFTGVTFENNQGVGGATYGAAIYIDDGTLVMDRCKVVGNGCQSDDGESYVGAYTILHIWNSSNVTLTDTEFLDNGYAQEAYIGVNSQYYTSVVKTRADSLSMERCTFSGNQQVYLIDSEASMLTAVDSVFTDNGSHVFLGNCANTGFDNKFTGCRFSGNVLALKIPSTYTTFYFNTNPAHLTFEDCDLGDSVFSDAKRVTIIDSHADKQPEGSIFGSGSVSMVVAMTALMISAAALGLSIASYKKKTAANEK